MSVAQYWGSAPEVLTVSASPSPTASVFTVSSAANLLAGQWINVSVGGEYERARIDALAGNQLTLTTALSAPPDAPGSVLNRRVLITNHDLNAGGLFNALSIEELASIDTTWAADGLKYFVSDGETTYGIYRFMANSYENADDVLVIQPDTGPGRWVLVSGFGSGLGTQTTSLQEKVHELELRMRRLEYSNFVSSNQPGARVTFAQGEFSETISVPAASTAHFVVLVTSTGVDLWPGDGFTAYPLLNMSQTVLNFCTVCIGQNTILVTVTNPTAAAVAFGACLWSIVIFEGGAHAYK